MLPSKLFGANVAKKSNWNKYVIIYNEKKELWVSKREKIVKTNMTVITREVKTCKRREETNGSSNELIWNQQLKTQWKKSFPTHFNRHSVLLHRTRALNISSRNEKLTEKICQMVDINFA